MKDAVEAAEREDWSACLTALLVAWRPQRQSELAELIDRVGARVPAAPVRPETKFIVKRTATATDADLTQLTATITRQLRTFPAVIKLGVALAADRAPDPRIATMLAAAAPFNELRTRNDLAVVEALDAIDDPRYRRLITGIADALEPRRMRLVNRRPQINAVLVIADTIKARPVPSKLTASALAAISEIDAALARPTNGTVDRSALIATIYREPENLAARLIYADALLDDGDVRGELITLQCSRADHVAPSARERRLLKDHERIWLGAIEPYVLKKNVVYRRGFVAEAQLAPRPLLTAPTELEWQTLERLDVGNLWGPVMCRWLASLPNLRHVANLHADDVAKIPGPVPWTTLGLRFSKAEAGRRLIQEKAAFPQLRELVLEATSVSAELLEALGPLGLQRLRLLTRNTTAGLLADALRITQQLGIRELVLQPEGSPSTSIAIAGSHALIEYEKAPYITGMLTRLPAGAIRTVSSSHPIDEATAAWLVQHEIAIRA